MPSQLAGPTMLPAEQAGRAAPPSLVALEADLRPKGGAVAALHTSIIAALAAGTAAVGVAALDEQRPWRRRRAQPLAALRAQLAREQAQLWRGVGRGHQGQKGKGEAWGARALLLAGLGRAAAAAAAAAARDGAAASARCRWALPGDAAVGRGRQGRGALLRSGCGGPSGGGAAAGGRACSNAAAHPCGWLVRGALPRHINQAVLQGGRGWSRAAEQWGSFPRLPPNSAGTLSHCRTVAPCQQQCLPNFPSSPRRAPTPHPLLSRCRAAARRGAGVCWLSGRRHWCRRRSHHLGLPAAPAGQDEEQEGGIRVQGQADSSALRVPHPATTALRRAPRLPAGLHSLCCPSACWWRGGGGRLRAPRVVAPRGRPLQATLGRTRG